MTTFGTGYSDWDNAEKTWAEAKAKRDAAPKRTPHGDPFASALDKLTPLPDAAWERIEKAAKGRDDLAKLAELEGELPIEATALADAREVISDTLFELGHVLRQLDADDVVAVHVPRVRGILRSLYNELNGWANQHDLSPVDFVGRNDEELS